MSRRPIVITFLANTASLDRAFAKIQGSALATVGALQRTSARLQATGAKWRATGRSLTTGLTVPIAAVGGVALKSSVAFETAMTRVRSLVGASAGQVRRWGDQILALAGQVGRPPQELAEALYFVTSAGIPAARALQVVEVSAKAAAAGLGETGTVADAVTTVLGAYGLKNISAARAVDILVAATREGKMEADALAGSLGRVVPIAAATGVQFAELAGLAAALSLQGLSAEEATTALRAVLTNLAKPGAQASKILKELGWSADGVRQSLRERGLHRTLLDLWEATGHNVETFGRLLPNVRGLTGALALTGPAADKVRGILDRVASSQGDLDAAFTKTARSGAHRMRQAMASLQATMIRVGNVILPVVARLAEGAGKLAAAFSRLPQGVQTAVVVLAALLAVIGPLVWMAGALASAIGLLLTPVGLVVGGLVALGVGLVLLYRRSAGFRRVVDRVRDALIGFGRKVAEWAPKVWQGIRQVWDRVAGALRVAANWVVGAWQRVSGWAKTAWSALQQAAAQVRSALAPIIGGVREVIGAVGDLVGALIGAARQGSGPFRLAATMIRAAIEGLRVGVRVLVAVWRAVWPVMVRVVQTAWATIAPVVRTGARIMQAVLVGALRVMAAVTKHMWGVIRTVVSTVLRVIAAIIRAVTAAIRGDWGRVWHEVKRIIEVVWAGIVALVRQGIETARAIIAAVLGAISAVWSNVWGWMRQVVGTVWQGIVGVVQWAIDRVQSLIGGLAGFLGAMVGAIRNAAARIGSAIWEGITGAVSGIVGWLRDRLNDLISLLNRGIRQFNRIPLMPDMPEIPRLAAGGVVMRPTLALVGEAGPEVVVPLHRAGRAGLGGVHMHTTLHVHGSVYGVDGLQQLLDERDRALARRMAATIGGW